jgi:hypothetical protein
VVDDERQVDQPARRLPARGDVDRVVAAHAHERRGQRHRRAHGDEVRAAVRPVRHGAELDVRRRRVALDQCVGREVEREDLLCLAPGRAFPVRDDARRRQGGRVYRRRELQPNGVGAAEVDREPHDETDQHQENTDVDERDSALRATITDHDGSLLV